MQKIFIHKLGPVNDCELEIRDFTVFTGPQASGKSTVAKSIFFFKNMKNLLYAQFQRKCLLQDSIMDERIDLPLKNRLERELRSNFLQIFGTTWYMDTGMRLVYHYTEDIIVKVFLREDPHVPNVVWFEFSDNLLQFVYTLEEMAQKVAVAERDAIQAVVRERIDSFFKDSAEIVYVPAGRSMITLLGTQLNYIYSSMDDTQKKNLDYCTQNYLERILRLKPAFSVSIEQMIHNTIYLTDKKMNKQMLTSAAKLIKNILQGEYRYVDGEERLHVSEKRYVKINFASSGQQEAVWILNTIFYNLLNNKRSYFIIEEPESHLFPNAQKLMAEFIALAKSDGKNQIFITTHSPYILGTVNNLLYADKISQYVVRDELEKIVSSDKWLKFSEMSAHYVEHGQVSTCTDDEFCSIENEVIDGASEDINRDYERMVLLKEECLSGGEKNVVDS